MQTPSTTRPATPAPGLPGLLDELRWRGMLSNATPGLADRLATGTLIRGYNGFDPSGPSLHIGSLVPIMGLMHLQQRGGAPVALVGGGTGMIGDPSGRSSERNLLDRATLEANVAGIRGQLERFLDFSSGPTAATMPNNLDWLGEFGFLEFLRDVGKHFTIAYMYEKDSVQTRLASGLSYTEFSYMLLQAADFRHLYRQFGVELQMGGADQWGNITAGLELIRRTEGAGEESGGHLAHGLSYPLFTDATGAKFGKTAAGTSVWLDAKRTTPYEFYQYWLATEDADVGGRLRTFTLIGREEIEALEAEAAASPELRTAQRRLALDVTSRVHGADEAARAIRVSEALFSGGPLEDPALLDEIWAAIGGAELAKTSLLDGALAVSVASGLYASNGEARRSISQGGFSINGSRVAAPEDAVPAPIGGRYLVLRHGKRTLKLARLV